MHLMLCIPRAQYIEMILSGFHFPPMVCEAQGGPHDLTVEQETHPSASSNCFIDLIKEQLFPWSKRSIRTHQPQLHKGSNERFIIPVLKYESVGTAQNHVLLIFPQPISFAGCDV